MIKQHIEATLDQADGSEEDVEIVGTIDEPPAVFATDSSAIAARTAGSASQTNSDPTMRSLLASVPIPDVAGSAPTIYGDVMFANIRGGLWQSLAAESKKIMGNSSPSPVGVDRCRSRQGTGSL